MSTVDAGGSGRLLLSTTIKIISEVQDLVRGDRRLKLREITCTLSISSKRVDIIFPQRKVINKKVLTVEKKRNHVTYSK